ncbi:MAG: hypothetical protein WC917_00570 [Bacilli bacterium]|jgi:hypothetical protein
MKNYIWIRLDCGDYTGGDITQICATKIIIERQIHNGIRYIFIKLIGFDGKEWFDIKNDFIDDSSEKSPMMDSDWENPISNNYLSKTYKEYSIYQDIIWEAIKKNEFLDLTSLHEKYHEKNPNLYKEV